MAAAKEIKRPKDFILPFYGMTPYTFLSFVPNLNIELMVSILFSSSIWFCRPKQQLIVTTAIPLFLLNLPSTGLGQTQLKLKDLKNSLSSFEKVLQVYPENVESLKVSLEK